MYYIYSIFELRYIYIVYRLLCLCFQIQQVVITYVKKIKYIGILYSKKHRHHPGGNFRHAALPRDSHRADRHLYPEEQREHPTRRLWDKLFPGGAVAAKLKLYKPAVADAFCNGRFDKDAHASLGVTAALLIGLQGLNPVWL